MDGRDDLRAAFEHRQAQEDRRAHEREALDHQRADFEREEDAVRQRLYEVADLTVQTLATSKPEKIIIMPKKPGACFPNRVQAQATGTPWVASASEKPLSRAIFK